MVNFAIQELTEFIMVKMSRHSRLPSFLPVRPYLSENARNCHQQAGIFYLCLLAGLDRLTHRQLAKYKTDHPQALTGFNV